MSDFIVDSNGIVLINSVCSKSRDRIQFSSSRSNFGVGCGMAGPHP